MLPRRGRKPDVARSCRSPSECDANPLANGEPGDITHRYSLPSNSSSQGATLHSKSTVPDRRHSLAALAVAMAVEPKEGSASSLLSQAEYRQPCSWFIAAGAPSVGYSFPPSFVLALPVVVRARRPADLARGPAGRSASRATEARFIFAHVLCRRGVFRRIVFLKIDVAVHLVESATSASTAAAMRLRMPGRNLTKSGDRSASSVAVLMTGLLPKNRDGVADGVAVTSP